MPPTMTNREREIMRARALKALNQVLARHSDALGRLRVVDPKRKESR